MVEDLVEIEYPTRKEKCKACNLRENCSQIVKGMGPLDADVIFIGDCPDKYADKHNEPFSEGSPHGDALDWVLEESGLKIDQVRMTYAVGCRPKPDHGLELPPPIPSVEVCRHWIFMEIDLITKKRKEKGKSNPAVIGIGTTAAYSLLNCHPGTPAGDLAGMWYENTRFFPEHNLFFLQSFNTLKPTEDKKISRLVEIDWKEHICQLIRGLHMMEFIPEPTSEEYKRFQKIKQEKLPNPFAE